MQNLTASQTIAFFKRHILFSLAEALTLPSGNALMNARTKVLEKLPRHK